MQSNSRAVRPPEPGPAGELLVLSADGKGIVMRRAASGGAPRTLNDVRIMLLSNGRMNDTDALCVPGTWRMAASAWATKVRASVSCG